MKVGDLVVWKVYNQDVIFCIIDFHTNAKGECVAVLKALYNNTLIMDAPVEELENILTTRNL